jgi:hypothetical protein
MDQIDARAALRRMGITHPSQDLVENWLRVALAEERLAAQERAIMPVPTNAEPQAPREKAADPERVVATVQPSASAEPRPAQGKSLLEPVLRDQRTRPPGKRKPGRPRIVASWFPAVAKTMADGTTLATALAINGLRLGPSECRALYRNRTFKAMYQEARRRYLLENWGRKGPSLRSVLGRAL